MGSLRTGDVAVAHGAGGGHGAAERGQRLVAVLQRVDEPTPRDFGEQRVDGEIRVEIGLDVGDEAQRAVPRFFAVRVVEQDQAAESAALHGPVTHREFLGATVRYGVRIGESEILIETPFQSGSELRTIGDVVGVALPPERMLYLPA